MTRRLSAFERLVSARQGEPWGDGCWTWRGSKDAKGYGFIRVNGKTRRVHIVAFELANGRPVKPGYTVEHECRNTSCWRPSHLTELTRSENTARGNRENPRSTEKARAAKRRGVEVVVHDGAFIRKAVADAAARIMAEGRGDAAALIERWAPADETVTPITPRNEGGG